METLQFQLTDQEAQYPQVLLWVDLIRTNSTRYKDIPISPESIRRAQENAWKATTVVEKCGGFRQYWDIYKMLDNMARSYQEYYPENAFDLAMAQYLQWTQYARENFGTLPIEESL